MQIPVNTKEQGDRIARAFKFSRLARPQKDDILEEERKLFKEPEEELVSCRD